jgi:hypothetical protein
VDVGRCIRFAGLLFAILAAVTLQAQGPVQPAAGNEVVGFYRIVQTTDLGTEVVGSLQIRLVNNNQPELFVTKLALFSRTATKKPEETAVEARLAPREAATFTENFTVSRAEYERWRKGARPSLRVTFQPSEGGEIMRTISLEPSRARRPQ